MSTWPVSSVLDARTQTFPELSDAFIERLLHAGKTRKVSTGDILFQPGDQSVPFFVVLSGELEIVQIDHNGERPIVTHTAKHFTGEMSMISGQRCLVLGRVSKAGEFLEISPESLRSIVASDAELSEILLRAFILRRVALIQGGYGSMVLLGSRHSAATLYLREFLGRNAYPYRYVDLDTDKTSQEMLDRFQVKVSDIPVVICGAGNVFRNPSIQQLADCLGFNFQINTTQTRDVVIVGAGPSGLAAAVYAASEGLDALVVGIAAPGGQAGSSSKSRITSAFPSESRVRNSPRVPSAQAQKFGAQMMIAHRVVELRCSTRPYEVVLDDGNVIAARSIVISTGAQYNKPPSQNLKKFEGQGIYYGATYIESQFCTDADVIVVGGGNSAGQAAVFLSQTARKVHMLVRSNNLSDSMSRYLIQRIEENPEDRNALLHRNRRARWRPGAGACQLDRSEHRRNLHPRHWSHLHHGGCFAPHLVASRLRRTRRQRVHSHRP